jgi:hypothetical protein
MEVTMTRVEEIERQIQALPPDELGEVTDFIISFTGKAAGQSGEVRLPGHDMTAEELAALGMDADMTIEECIAEAQWKRDRRLADPEHHSLANIIGSLKDTKPYGKTKAEVMAWQRSMRDEWD